MAEINSDALHQASSMDEEAIEVMKQHNLSSAKNSDVTADPSAVAADVSHDVSRPSRPTRCLYLLVAYFGIRRNLSLSHSSFA